MFRRFRIPKVRQHDVSDCGAACMSSVAEHYGLRLPISRIRQRAATDGAGTTVRGLIDAATALGFVARGVRGDPGSLARIPRPAIAHLLLPNGLQHFVVIYAVTPRHVVVMDPFDGRVRRLARDEFLARWTGVLVLLLPAADFRPANLRGSVAGRFWHLVRPHRTVMLQALLGAAVYTLLGLSTAVFVQKLVDHVLVGGDRALLNLMGVVMLGLLAAQLFIGASKGVLSVRTGQKIDAALILGYYTHLLELPQRFFDAMRVGEIISRVNDAVKIRAFINDMSLDLAVNLLVVVLSFSLMLLYSPRLTLVMAGIIPLYLVIYWAANRLNRKTQRRMMESSAELEAHLVESLNSVSTIKRFGLERMASLRTEMRFVRVLRNVYRSGITSVSTSSASEFTTRLFTILVLWVGGGYVLDRMITPGELMSFYAIVGFMSGPLASLVGANRALQDAVIAADRLYDILDLEREEEEEEGRVELTPDRLGDIRFDAVSFRYGNRRPLFEALDLTIPLGRITAIVGESGSGKSTLAALLQRVYPPTDGRIRIGEVDLRHVTRASLRRISAAVPQNVHLFDGSLLDNIALGDPEPDLARVLSVTRMVGIDSFIDDLPAGLGTRVGENGVALSGGQRQRIAIARALYRDPPILVLDEATASLDSVSEQFVRNAIDSLRRQNRTVILIAHRLSSIADADSIVVLDGGSVVESGTHADLLARDGPYARLWRSQQGMVPVPVPP